MAAPIDAATGELWYRQWASAGCTFRPCYWVWEDKEAQVEATMHHGESYRELHLEVARVADAYARA